MTREERIATLLAAAVASEDRAQAAEREVAALRDALGWVPLSVREAVRKGDAERAAEWAAKRERYAEELTTTHAEMTARAFRDGAEEMRERVSGWLHRKGLRELSRRVADMPLNGCGQGVHDPCPGCECRCHGRPTRTLADAALAGVEPIE